MAVEFCTTAVEFDVEAVVFNAEAVAFGVEAVVVFEVEAVEVDGRAVEFDAAAAELANETLGLTACCKDGATGVALALLALLAAAWAGRATGLGTALLGRTPTSGRQAWLYHQSCRFPNVPEARCSAGGLRTSVHSWQTLAFATLQAMRCVRLHRKYDLNKTSSLSMSMR